MAKKTRYCCNCVSYHFLRFIPNSEPHCLKTGKRVCGASVCGLHKFPEEVKEANRGR